MERREKNTASLEAQLTELKAYVSKLSLYQQKLIDTRDQLDRELERFAGIHRYNTRAIIEPDHDSFARITTEAVLELYEIEFAALWLAKADGSPEDQLARVTGVDPATLTRDDLLSLMEQEPFRQSGILITELAEKGIANLVVCLCRGPAGRPRGYLQAGVTLKRRPYFPVISPEHIKSFSVFAQQVGALLQNRLDQATIKENLRQLTVARERAENADRAKSKFLAEMSHEIRTPMSGILGMAELALQNATDPEQKDFIRKIRLSSESLLSILNDILDFSKIEAEKVQLENAPFKISKLIRELETLFSPSAQDKGLRLVVGMEEVPDGPWLGDRLRLSQVLSNLLSNAVKFTATGEVRLSARQTARNRLEFSVRDTGIGMPEEQMHHLFKPFTQGESSTTRRYGGTGLGLAISYELVSLMGGKLTVQSEVNQGSCFQFELEMQPAPQTPPLRPKPEPPRHPEASDKPRAGDEEGLRGHDIIVAEDHPINAEIVRRFLERFGVRARIAGNGAEAVDLHRAAPADLILMDMRMPVMDGLTATRKIREFDKEVPVIGLTANAFEEDVEKSLKAGMNRHLSKPVTMALLRSVIGAFLLDPGSGDAR